MNSYRIDTFQIKTGEWKAVAYECGKFIAEVIDVTESEAITMVTCAMAIYIGDRG